MTRPLWCALCAAWLSVSIAHAQQQPPEQGRVRVVREQTLYEINADGTAVVSMERALSPLNQAAIAQVAQVARSYQEGSSEMEFLEAYTLKQDGRRIDVPADRILTQTPPALMQAPMFTDMKVKQAIFPDIAVGDQVVFRARFTILKPVFPGKFSVLEVFSKSSIYDGAQVRVKYPRTYPLKFFAMDVVEGKSTREGDSVVREWTYTRKEAEPIVPGEAQTLSLIPHLIITSFDGWKDLAQAYESRSKEKAAVTPEVRKLAEEITRGKSAPREQAEALYRWVSENIRYVAVYLGAGGFVPHDANSILSNRYGDCKDHVTLLEALLAAKGIDSSPVLINAQPVYQLPEGALPIAFNHVITWIPSLGVYADSTAQILPFGVLGAPAHGKPVLQTRDFKDVSYIPVMNPSMNVLRNRIEFTVGDDGKAVARSSMTGEGSMIPVVVTLARGINNPQLESAAVRNILSREGLTGSADLTHEPSELFGKSYSLNGDIKLDHWVNVPGPGAVRVPSGLFSAVPLTGFALTTLNSPPIGKTERPCGPVTIDEEATVQFPGGVKPESLPTDETFSNAIGSYESRYRQEGAVVKVTRKLVLTFPRPMCSPAEQAAHREVAERVRRDTSAQITYR